MSRALRAIGVLASAALLSLVPVHAVEAATVHELVHRTVTLGQVTGDAEVALPFPADYAVISWSGGEEDAPTVSWSTDGTSFGPSTEVGHDEILSRPEAGRTSSAIQITSDAVAVRVRAATPLAGVHLSLLDDVSRQVFRPVRREAQAATQQPPIVTRAQWGANEAWRPSPSYAPVQKLVVHHTASSSAQIDTDPAGYVRAVQAFHVQTRGYADIGYHFLIDRQGRVYEGRWARDYAPGEAPTGENTNNESIIGAHVGGTNTGLVGIAMLGDMTSQLPTAAQRGALVEMLAWESERHTIDPVGSSLYVGSSGNRTFPNIAGHREAALPSGATACPGDTFFPTLPRLRADVAARMRGGAFVPVSPKRLLDTRATGPVTPSAPATVLVRGRAPVPAGAAAAVVNITAVNGNASGYLVVHPSGEPPPVASTLNYAARTVVPNLTMARLGADGAFVVRTSVGAVHVLADIVGWFVDGSSVPPAAAARLQTLPAPVRLLDTRTPHGGGALWAGSRALTVRGRDGIPPTATAVVLNVTVDKPTAPSAYLTVYPDGEEPPVASNLNFVRGQTVPNLVVVGIGASGAVRLLTNSGSTHVIVDAVGWTEPGTSGSRFVPLSPSRVLDTRGGAADGFTVAVGPGERIDVPVRGVGGVPASSQASAVVLNVTVTQPTMSGFLTVWPSGVARPTASNLNYAAQQTVANLVVSGVGADGRVSVFNPRGSTHVLFDVVGWYATD